jgi:hypothetical protein
VNGTGLGLCPTADISIRDIVASGSVTRDKEALFLLKMCVTLSNKLGFGGMQCALGNTALLQ